MERKFTVSRIFRALKWRSQFVPFIRISGNWLASAGFTPGGKFTVRVENGALIVQPLLAEASK